MGCKCIKTSLPINSFRDESSSITVDSEQNVSVCGLHSSSESCSSCVHSTKSDKNINHIQTTLARTLSTSNALAPVSTESMNNIKGLEYQYQCNDSSNKALVQYGDVLNTHHIAGSIIGNKNDSQESDLTVHPQHIQQIFFESPDYILKKPEHDVMPKIGLSYTPSHVTYEDQQQQNEENINELHPFSILQKPDLSTDTHYKSYHNYPRIKPQLPPRRICSESTNGKLKRSGFFHFPQNVLKSGIKKESSVSSNGKKLFASSTTDMKYINPSNPSHPSKFIHQSYSGSKKHKIKRHKEDVLKQSNVSAQDNTDILSQSNELNDKKSIQYNDNPNHLNTVHSIIPSSFSDITGVSSSPDKHVDTSQFITSTDIMVYPQTRQPHLTELNNAFDYKKQSKDLSTCDPQHLTFLCDTLTNTGCCNQETAYHLLKECHFNLKLAYALLVQPKSSSYSGGTLLTQDPVPCFGWLLGTNQPSSFLQTPPIIEDTHTYHLHEQLTSDLPVESNTHSVASSSSSSSSSIYHPKTVTQTTPVHIPISQSKNEPLSDIYHHLQQFNYELFSIYGQKMRGHHIDNPLSYQKGQEHLLYTSDTLNHTPLNSSHSDMKILKKKFSNYQTIMQHQHSILPHHLQQSQIFSEIILESSIIVGGLGQMLMLPWNEHDSDIQNNFWMFSSPPIVNKLLEERRLQSCFKETLLYNRTLLPLQQLYSTPSTSQLQQNSISFRTDHLHTSSFNDSYMIPFQSLSFLPLFKCVIPPPNHMIPLYHVIDTTTYMLRSLQLMLSQSLVNDPPSLLCSPSISIIHCLTYDADNYCNLNHLTDNVFFLSLMSQIPSFDVICDHLWKSLTFHLLHPMMSSMISHYLSMLTQWDHRHLIRLLSAMSHQLSLKKKTTTKMTNQLLAHLQSYAIPYLLKLDNVSTEQCIQEDSIMEYKRSTSSVIYTTTHVMKTSFLNGCGESYSGLYENISTFQECDHIKKESYKDTTLSSDHHIEPLNEQCLSFTHQKNLINDHQHPSIICRTNSIRQTSLTPDGTIESPIQQLGQFIDGWSLEDGRWTDPDGYMSLSQKQRQKFYAWRRITDLFPLSDTSIPPCIIFDRPKSSVIRQGFVGDCSFLSSLAVLAEYEQSHNIPLLSGIIYPQQPHPTETHRSIPVINQKGFYACRVFFNGVPRKVVLDDYVPIRKDGKLLSAHSSNKREFWVSLLEKSFVKLMGGSYFMQGSNPGADLYHLTGWIPETIPFRVDIHTGSPDTHRPIVTGGTDVLHMSSDPKWSFVWTQLYDGLSYGKCVACLGTSEVADAAPSGLDYPEGVSRSSGIVARHAYSILNFKEINGKRLLYVKNPWCCIRWRGTFSPYDISTWTDSLQLLLHYDRKKRAEIDDGCFWIDWDDVVQWFSHLYICWNPICFKYQVEIHSKWDKTTYVHHSILPDDSHLVAFNPQFLLTIHTETTDNLSEEESIFEVWILLSRHVRERKRDLSQKYLAVHIQSGFERVTCPPPPIKQGIYSNGECTLVKLLLDGTTLSKKHDINCDSTHNITLSKTTTLPIPIRYVTSSTIGGEIIDTQSSYVPLTDSQYILVVSQYSQKDEFNFTVKAYSSKHITLTQLPPLISPQSDWISLYLQGEWITSTAGGCSNNLWLYFTNPHARLYLPQSADIILFLECPQEHSVNLRIFKHPAATARILRSGKALSSGPYRAGCCVIKTHLEAGCYTLILSTFRPGELGTFQICLHAGNFSSSLSNSSKDVYKDGRCYFTNNEPVLSLLPYAYVDSPLPGFYHHELWSLNGCFKQSLLQGFGGVIRINHLKTSESLVLPSYINVALRLKVHHLSPVEVYPSIVVYRRRLSSDTTDDIARTDVVSSPSKHLIPVARSDLEGGQSDIGRSLSSAAQDLYKKQGIITLSHFCFDTQKSPYYIVVSSAFLIPLNGTSTFCIVSVDSPHCPCPLPLEATEGDFTLHIISDHLLEVTR